MSSWEHFGQIANVAQLAGLDAVRLIAMIVKAANTARMHKQNCMQFAQHLKLIGNLLESLKISELKKYPETREPLEQLEDALRRSYILVNSCRDRSYFYLLAMGWNIVYQFRRAQDEIDRYLKIIPLIALVDNTRVRQRLDMIEMDKYEYTLDNEDKKVQDVIMKREPSKHDTIVLTKNLSCSYPNMPIKEALKKEREKLQQELKHSQANLDVRQCEVIHHLLEVTEAVAASSVLEKGSLTKESKVDQASKDIKDEEGYHAENYDQSTEKQEALGNKSSLSTQVSHEEWHSDLLGCCSEPLLCVKTLFCPCTTFSRIASVAKNRYISPGEACNELMAYSLILSCCCYTCCIRRKLRKIFNIPGGFIDDFLSHLMCCCCALVQEWREIENREVKGPWKTQTNPPPVQYIEY
ncbi:protein MID1-COMPLEMENTING ACTIVITY 1-like [Andrographis paniculata]|uniref:protein MID1-COMPLEMENTING ACTIVITY 1-like n=1 Tax=Andrographis paniculata TaxID=175694 RepID=UPI0021E82720|nr:protein MID1-COMPLEMENTING ACTIVITY 1-like [Andrographis paniculata]